MTQYSPAIDIVSTLLITQIFLSLNMAVFVNLYKAYQKQNEYFKRLLIGLGTAFCLDLIVSLIHPDINLYAYATLISCIVWLLLNMKYYKHLVPEKSELIYVIALLFMYVLTLFLGNYILRAVIYFIAYVILTKFLMKAEWDYLCAQVVTLSKRMIRK